MSPLGRPLSQRVRTRLRRSLGVPAPVVASKQPSSPCALRKAPLKHMSMIELLKPAPIREIQSGGRSPLGTQSPVTEAAGRGPRGPGLPTLIPARVATP